jgi:GNAT superfamily N-acetyltransferase
MILFSEHEEYSDSATREGCAEVRDVFVVPERRRSGVARTLMRSIEDAARANGWSRIGLAVASSVDAEPARRLYEAMGYRFAHGPFISTTDLAGDDGPLPVGSVMSYLVKDLVAER